MPDIKNAIYKPDVCFRTYAAVAQTRVEWDVAPVVVVAVEWFLWCMLACYIWSPHVHKRSVASRASLIFFFVNDHCCLYRTNDDLEPARFGYNLAQLLVFLIIPILRLAITRASGE